MNLNRKLRSVALVAIPIEVVSLLLFFLCPIDVGYPPGTPLIYQVPVIGVWLHLPWLLANLDSLPFVVAYPLLVLIGYSDVLALLLIFFVPYLAIRNLAVKGKASNS